jgi:hypothetical protein
MHLNQCSCDILLCFGIICQPYCCNYQHFFNVYIT